MKRSVTIFILLAISMLALSACSSTPQSTTNPANFQQGQISGTPMTAPQGLSQATSAVIATAGPTETSASTSTPDPTLTPTSVSVNLTVISAITCVSGPGESYGFAGYLKTGAVLTAQGRNEKDDYFYIQNPSKTDGYCWVWNNYVLINGVSSDLPVVESK